MNNEIFKEIEVSGGFFDVIERHNVPKYAGGGNCVAGRFANVISLQKM